MKTKMITVCLLGALVAFLPKTGFAQKKESKSEIVYFYVNELTCGHCKATVERAIPFEKGVTDLQCDLPSKMVAVRFDATKTDTIKLKRAFEKIKMPAKVIPVTFSAKEKEK